MRSFCFLLMILIIPVSLYSQLKPNSFLLGNETSINKINESLPASNSITDIIAVGDTLWLGTSRGVSLSTDNGSTWTNFYGHPEFGTDNVSAIGYYNGIFWAATAITVEQNNQRLPQGTGLRYTSDLGNTWRSVPQPLDDPADTTIQYGINVLRALPVTVAVQNLAYDIAFTPGTIWISTFAGGLRRAEIDSLVSKENYKWKRVVLPPDNRNSIMPTDELDFCLSPVPGNFCAEGNLNHRVFSVITDDDNTLYVGTANGINKSSDDGLSWVKFNHQNQDEPISGNFITALGFNTNNNTLWASSWKAEDPDEFYAVSFSNDNGESWRTVLHDERPHNFGFKNNQAMVPTDNGVFRSSDGGSTWINANSIVDTISDPSTKIFLRTSVFYSAASSGNYVWLGSNDGLARLNETPGAMWSGQWKLFFAAQNLTSAGETYCYPNPFSPRQDNLKIIYSTGGESLPVTITIYDFSFNYVNTILQNAVRIRGNDGPPDFWDGRDSSGNYVPNGVYFYRVEVEGKDPVFGKVIVLQ